MNDTKKMTPTLEFVRSHRVAILQAAAEHKAFNVRIFGSVARNEAHSESDIDFLVDFQDDAAIWDAVGLWTDLKKLLGRDVNVIGEEEKSDRFMKTALRDAVPL